ncbi:MAG: aminoacyl-tRNA hydrolase [Alphaproteobacteria bacterium]
MFSIFKKKKSDMWLFVGLGNPGGKYAKNRHNVGFMAVDALAGEYGFGGWRSKFQSEMSEGRIGDKKIVLLKPQAYMNESGQAIQKAAKFYKIDPSRIVIFHDELDLNAGKMRVKVGGGVAGHNGLKSARACLGTADFVRVRMGIGHPGDRAAVSGYVLSDFAKAEVPIFERLIDACARHITMLLDDNADDFMTRVVESVSVK